VALVPTREDCIQAAARVLARSAVRIAYEDAELLSARDSARLDHMATTFGDAAAAGHGRSVDYERGWADANRSAYELVQWAVDQWRAQGMTAEAVGLTKIRDAIGNQRPE